MQYAGRMLVEDSNGCRFQLHEYRKRRMFRADVRRFVLETGESVRRINFDNYVIAKTGETLVRIDAS
jgi:hypothetical protein